MPGTKKGRQDYRSLLVSGKLREIQACGHSRELPGSLRTGTFSRIILHPVVSDTRLLCATTPVRQRSQQLSPMERWHGQDPLGGELIVIYQQHQGDELVDHDRPTGHPWCQPCMSNTDCKNRGQSFMSRSFDFD